MGNTTAKAEVDSMINNSVDIINSSVQSCSGKVQGSEVVNVVSKDCNNTNITIGDIDLDATYYVVTSDCVQTATSNNTTKQDIQTQITNAASSISQLAQLSSADASAVTKLTENLATTITNSYTQNCDPSSSSSETVNIKCQNGNNDNITVGNIKEDDMSSVLSKCVQNTTSVNNVTDSIKTIIDNSATAEVSGFFPLLIIAIICLGIFAVFMYSGTQIVSSGGFWSGLFLIIDVLVIIWLVVAKVRSWYPFQDCVKN